jgi:hypothetical protein
MDAQEVMAALIATQRLVERLLAEREALMVDRKRLRYAVDHGWLDLEKLDAAILGYRGNPEG